MWPRLSLLGALAYATTAIAGPVDANSLVYTPLNPARGDASPQAANLWGDRTTPGAAGFIVRFADGFASPPHIHNISYRAVVLDGAVHNDDPDAASLWMEPGSFWTQPSGEGHITSSTGVSLAYVEIDDGPYLVEPVERAHDTGERPLNLDRTNLVWSETGTAGVQEALLWGQPDNGPGGRMLRLSPGHHVRLRSSQPLRALVVLGTMSDRANALGPGSLFQEDDLRLTCSDDEDCWLYLRAEASVRLSR